MEKRRIRVHSVCVVSILLGALLLSGSYAWAKDPIKIGINTELTGVMAEASNNVKLGYDVYLGEIGHKVAGREIQIIEQDNKTDPKISVEVAQKLAEKDKVHIMCFGTNSAAAIAVRQYVDRANVPLVIVGQAGAERVTLPPSKWVFRVPYADGQVELPLGRYAYEKLGYKQMALMGPDYAGSTGKLWAFQQEFEKSGGKILQTILWPLGTMDLAPYFAQLKPGVQAIFPFIPGDISVNRFLGQFFEMGLDKKGIKLCTHWTMTADYLTIKTFGDKMLGAVSGGLYCIECETPENKHFKEAFKAKYEKKKENQTESGTGYEAMKFLCKAIEAINGNVEDKEAFLKAMQETQMKGLCSSKISMDKNGNVIRDIVIMQVKKVNGELKNTVLDIIPQMHQPPQGYTVMPGR